jgi:hypothetical protein
MMTTKERFESGVPNIVKVSDYHGHEEGLIRHEPGCPHHNAAYNGASPEIRPEGLYADCLRWTPPDAWGHHCDGPFDALYMETTHAGHVLYLREYNGSDDSDFYAMVWDPVAKEPVRVDYATTRGWTYPNGAAVDATPEVLAAYGAWCGARRLERLAACEAARVAAEEKAAKEPCKGRRCTVVRGRKVPVGFTGVCIWYGNGRYGARVGIKDAAGKVEFTAATNVEVCP